MKRLTLLLLTLLLLLCGCGDESDGHQTGPSETEIAAPEVTQPPTFATYEENSDLETQTGGAVKCYQVADAPYYAMRPMGEGIVLFSGETQTTLTYVTGDNLPIQTTLDGLYIRPEDPSVQITENGISYYEPNSHSLIFLGLELRPVSRVPLSSEVPGQPVLSQDWKLLYYYTKDALRCMDLRSGISRLLKESGANSQQAKRLLFDGALLECIIAEGEVSKTVLVNTQTGETRFTSTEPLELTTHGPFFYAGWKELDQKLWLVGSQEEGTKRLVPLWENGVVSALHRNTLTVCRDHESGLKLAWYNLTEDGVCATVQLAGLHAPVGLTAWEASGEQCFIAKDMDTGKHVLCVWKPSMSLLTDNPQTLAPYYTPQFPDEEGLERCEELVQPLRDEYGLRIRLWQDAVKVVPKGYRFTAEHSAEIYERCLPMLEKAVRAYPKEIYKRLGKKSANGKLTVCLVREIYESDELGSLKQEQGVYFIHKGSEYLVLSINDEIETSYYHELFHAMDSYIMVEAQNYDDWGTLNPEGFAYDNSYLANESRDPKNYLDEGTRAFIDTYSMSYPKEDRARIMEYAMQDGNEAYFTSEIMSRKLEKLCKGIRKAFKLKDDEMVYPWEQYLS